MRRDLRVCQPQNIALHRWQWRFIDAQSSHYISHTPHPQMQHTYTTHTHGREVLIKPPLNICHGLTGQLNGVDPSVGKARVEETTFEPYCPYCCRSRACGGKWHVSHTRSNGSQTTVGCMTYSPMQGLLSAESIQQMGPFLRWSSFPHSIILSTPTPRIELFSSLCVGGCVLCACVCVCVCACVCVKQ